MKKNIIAVIFLIGWFLFMVQDADALSLQLRGREGVFLGNASGHITGVGLDVFIYEGQNLDIFLGAEQSSSSGTAIIDNLRVTTGQQQQSFLIKSDFSSSKATRGILGFHYRATTESRVKPYFSLEAFYQKVDIELKSEDLNYTVVSTGEQESQYGGELGLGTDIGISDRLIFTIGAYLTGSELYRINVVVRRNSDGREFKGKLAAGVYNAGINLGLRYAF